MGRIAQAQTAKTAVHKSHHHPGAKVIENPHSVTEINQLHGFDEAVHSVDNGHGSPHSRSSTPKSAKPFEDFIHSNSSILPSPKRSILPTAPDAKGTADLLHAAEAHLRDDIAEGGILTKGSRPPGSMPGEDHRDANEDVSGYMRFDYTNDRWFNAIIAVAILCNAITMGVETDYPEGKAFYYVAEHIFTFIFTWEMITKIIFMKAEYFKDSWNILDFVLVWMSIMDCWILPMAVGGTAGGARQLSILRILRVMRVIRFIRLLKVFKELWLIIKGMVASVKTIFWASLLLMLLLYVSGIFCVQMIGKSDLYKNSFEEALAGENDYFPDWDAYQFYGTVPRGMFTLFEVCLEPLSLRPILEKQLFMGPFFLMYIFLTTFGVMNVIIGVIVENTMEASRQATEALDDLEKAEKMVKVETIRDACMRLDKDGSGSITPAELKEGLLDPDVSKCLVELALPYGSDENELFELLDSAGLGVISHGAMMTSLARNIMQSDAQHAMELKGSMHAAKRSVNGNQDYIDDVDTCIKKLEDQFDKHTHRVDQVELFSLEISRHFQDLVALGAGLPAKPQEFVDNAIKEAKEKRNAKLGVRKARKSAGGMSVEDLLSSQPPEAVVPPIEAPQKAHESRYDHGAKSSSVGGMALRKKNVENIDTQSRGSRDKSKHFGEWSVSDEVKPSKMKVPLSPRGSHGSHGDLSQRVEGSLPAIPLPLNLVDHDQESIRTTSSQHTRQSKASKWSDTSAMSVPPALNLLLTAADFQGPGGDEAMGQINEIDFSFLPAPESYPSGSHDRALDSSIENLHYEPNVTKLASFDDHASHDEQWKSTEALLLKIPPYGDGGRSIM